jgi:hypothetical protein
MITGSTITKQFRMVNLAFMLRVYLFGICLGFMKDHSFISGLEVKKVVKICEIILFFVGTQKLKVGELMT